MLERFVLCCLKILTMKLFDSETLAHTRLPVVGLCMVNVVKESGRICTDVQLYL